MNEKNPLNFIENNENIISNEGVRLKIEPATVLSRILAFIIDIFFMITIGIMMAFTVYRFSNFFILNANSIKVLYIIIISAVTFFIPGFIETITKGYSLGKFILGIRVFKDNGETINFKHAFTRQLIAIAESYATFGVIAFITNILNKKGKRIGDFLAGTYVAKLPSYTSSLPLIIPEELKAWSQQVELANIPDKLFTESKILIKRTNLFFPKSRAEIGNRLSAELKKYVNILPPKNTDNERFIATVLIIKRDADYRKVLNSRNIV